MLAFASLPSIVGVEQELVCLWKFPFDCCCFANCHFCFELGVEKFLVLLSGWELPNAKRPSLPPGSSKGESKDRDSTETKESKYRGRREVMKQYSG